MKTITKTVIAFAFGATVFAATQASATYRPDYCPQDHDHRSHNASYYDYYEEDRYYRAGAYRGDRSYDRRSRRGDRYDRRSGRYDSYNRRPRSRVVHRQTYRTRYDARIVLVEEIYYTRSGREQLVCSVLVKGYDRRYVPHRRLKRIARRDCSPRARIQYL